MTILNANIIMDSEVSYKNWTSQSTGEIKMILLDHKNRLLSSKVVGDLLNLADVNSPKDLPWVVLGLIGYRIFIFFGSKWCWNTFSRSLKHSADDDGSWYLPKDLLQFWKVGICFSLCFCFITLDEIFRWKTDLICKFEQHLFSKIVHVMNLQRLG